MKQDDFDPFDPVKAAMGSLHASNLNAAKDAEICRLVGEVNRLTEAGNALFYNLLYAKPYVPDNGNTHFMIDRAVKLWNPKYGKTE